MDNIGLYKFDPVECCNRIAKEQTINPKNLSNNEIFNGLFLEELIKAISETKGKDLAPYLSEIIAHKTSKSIEFQIQTEQFEIEFKFKTT